MKLNVDFRVVNIVFGVVMLLCGISSEFAEGATLVWKNVSHQVSEEKSIESIADRVPITPAALILFNNLRGPALRPNIIIRSPKIIHVATSLDETNGASGNQHVKTYQIYSANTKCYAMVYAVAEITGRDEQFLAIFAFDGKTWVEIDRIEFPHPIRWG